MLGPVIGCHIHRSSAAQTQGHLNVAVSELHSTAVRKNWFASDQWDQLIWFLKVKSVKQLIGQFSNTISQEKQGNLLMRVGKQLQQKHVLKEFISVA